MKNLNIIIDKHIKSGLYPCAQWKIIHQKNVHEGKLGFLNIESQKPIVENALYRIWSMTKPIVSIVALQLIEENKIKLSDPITKYLPQFSNLKVLKNIDSTVLDLVDVNQMPTIKDLLSHTAGFSYNFLGDALAKEYDRVGLFHSETTTLEEEIDLLSTLPLLYQPSTRWVYSVSVDVLARIIEIITKGTLQLELQKRIFDPLDMKDTAFTVDKKNNDRLTESYEFDSLKKKLQIPITKTQSIRSVSYPTNKLSYARGGHGLFSTLEDYSKLAQMLLTGKTRSGEVIISQSMLSKATTNHLDAQFFPLKIKNFDEVVEEENFLAAYGWGLGFRVMIDVDKAEQSLGSFGEFGWGGAAATYFLVDPKNDLTAVLMTQVFGADTILQKDFVTEIYKNL